MKFLLRRQIPEFYSKSLEERKEIRKVAFQQVQIRVLLLLGFGFVLLVRVVDWFTNSVLQTDSFWVALVLTVVLASALATLIDGFVVNPSIARVVNETEDEYGDSDSNG